MSFQKFIIQGRLGADAEMSTLKSGTEVTKFRMASTRRFKSKDGERKEETTWATVTAYNGVASGIVDYLVKGKEVTVIGRIRTFEYEDKEGNTRYGWEVVAEEVVLGAGGRKDDDEEDERPARSKSKSSASKSKSKPSRRARDEDEDDDEDEEDDTKPW